MNTEEDGGKMEEEDKMGGKRGISSAEGEEMQIIKERLGKH